jgi:CRISPR-associated endonuclease/helicase Cas3
LDYGEYGRVLFLYPTRGTATEGFKDYIGWAPADEAMLLHSTSRYALEAMLENPPASARDKDYRLAGERLFSLSNYPRRFFSATVDQFLSFLQHSYGGVCMSTVLADSVVVIDEVHSFDRQLFNTLLAYLKYLDVPTLCMTATLQSERLSELTTLGMSVYPSVEDYSELQDLTTQSALPRYRFRREDDIQKLKRFTLEAVRSKKKVLWVVNTVSRCQRICDDLATLLECEFGEGVIAYHSRFRLKDRERRHDDVVERLSFDSKSVGLVAVTTQVCEMSLDLDADYLISELAPISSLIQRCGRVNRHAREPHLVADVQIYMPDDVRPYERTELNDASIFVKSAEALDSASQSDLSALMNQCEEHAEVGLKERSLLFESGYFAEPGKHRDIDEYTVQAILDSDLCLVHKRVQNKESIDAYIVPVPERFTMGRAPGYLPDYLHLASGKCYSEILGFHCEGQKK